MGFPQSQILKRFGFGVGENSSGAVRERDGRDFVNIWVFSSPELMLWRNEGGELVLKILGRKVIAIREMCCL